MTVLKNEHKILLLLLLWMTITCARAQEQDPWVGTWTSESFIIDYGERQERVRDVLRITKGAEGYLVRGKRIKLNDPNWVDHHKAYTVTGVEGKTIYLRQAPQGALVYPTDWVNVTYFYKLTLRSDETLHYLNYRCEYMDRDGNNKTRKYPGGGDWCDGGDRDFFKDDW